MKKTINASAAILLTSTIFMTACSSSKKTSSEPVTRKKNEIEVRHYSAAELEEGKTIWQSSCDRCHKLYKPESYTKTQWEKILPRMVKRSKLDMEQGGKVRGYLMSLAKS